MAGAENRSALTGPHRYQTFCPPLLLAVEFLKQKFSFLTGVIGVRQIECFFCGTIHTGKIIYNSSISPFINIREVGLWWPSAVHNLDGFVVGVSGSDDHGVAAEVGQRDFAMRKVGRGTRGHVVAIVPEIENKTTFKTTVKFLKLIKKIFKNPAWQFSYGITMSTKWLSQTKPVSYTHLTLPTKA